MKQIIIIVFLIFTGCNFNRETVVDSDSGDWSFSGFEKADSINPVLQPDTAQFFNCPLAGKQVRWEERNVLNPSAVVKDGKVYLLFRAQDNNMTSRIGIAVSDDGLHFVRQPQPVLFPDSDNMMKYEWRGGIEDPRIVESENGTYIMTYTAYDGKTARLCLASSKDLFHWEKHGLVLSEEKYKDTWSKSGAIVAKQAGNKITAVKINGKYWMYFGDTDLFMATSDDLISWNVAEDKESSKMISVLHPRKGYYDSRLVEPGPFALLRDSGILLIYNGSNAANYGDTTLPRYTYAAGQALFDKKQPYKLIDRMNEYFIHPDKPYERTGEVNEVCFVEGLVYFNGRWLLYYGTADSKIAVAIRSDNQ